MFHFQGTAPASFAIVKELQRILGFTVSESGMPVELREIADSSLHITKADQSVTIEYGSRVQLSRAIFLLVANQAKACYDIRQACAFEDLGLMLDVSRNAVLKVDTVKDMIRHMACLGYHTLQLYMEDTYEVEGEEYFGYMRGAYTAEEIKEIDAYCAIFGIELVPCIQTLAHLNQITRYERYDKIIDYENILFVGEDRTKELLRNIFSTVSKAFTCRKINIGMDEAHMLGLGKYLDKHGYHKRFELMVEHLKTVKALCDEFGFEPQMWSDMFFRLVYGGEYYVEQRQIPKELTDLIPKDIRLVYWDYYSTELSRYDNMLKNHLAISPNIGFAGGAWKWTGFAPENDFSIRSTAASMEACKQNGIGSFLLTAWGDNGAEASVYGILPTIYHCAERAYAEGGDTAGFKALTGISFEDFMAVDLPNRPVDAAAQRNNSNKYLLYNDVLIGTFDSLIPDGTGERYALHAAKLRTVFEKAGRYSEEFSTLQKLCRVLSIKAELGKHIKKAYDAHDKLKLNDIVNTQIPAVIMSIKSFYDDFTKQWHKENKPFGFEVQCIRLGGLMARLEYARNRIAAYLSGEVAQIEELEQERKPFAYFENLPIEKLSYNLWNVIASPGII